DPRILLSADRADCAAVASCRYVWSGCDQYFAGSSLAFLGVRRDVFRFDRLQATRVSLRRMYQNWTQRPASATGPARPWITGVRFRPLLHTVNYKARELGADTLDRHLFLAVPVRHRVGHAEDAEHCQARIEVGAKLAAPHPFPENVLKNSLQSARPFSDPPAAFARQVLTLVQEDPDKITAVGQR